MKYVINPIRRTSRA